MSGSGKIHGKKGPSLHGKEDWPSAPPHHAGLAFPSELAGASNPLLRLQGHIIACTRCPRLLAHCREVASVKRRAYRDWDYWGKPVPAFGDPEAEILILGLAPAAHGANRTGRMFTGDRSGDFLYRALWENGFASQPESVSVQDGLHLKNVWITASARCAPPDNKPLPDELRNCSGYLAEELRLLRNLKLVVALGRIAADAYLRFLQERAEIGALARFPFGHGVLHRPSESHPALLCSYHPSQQNTSTGRLTATMLTEIFRVAGSFSTRDTFPMPR